MSIVLGTLLSMVGLKEEKGVKSQLQMIHGLTILNRFRKEEGLICSKSSSEPMAGPEVEPTGGHGPHHIPWWHAHVPQQ